MVLDHLDVGVALAQRGARLQAGQLGHVEVEEDDVGRAALGERQGLAAVARQPRHLDARVGAQQRGGALAHEAMIVDHEHGDRAGLHLTREAIGVAGRGR